MSLPLGRAEQQRVLFLLAKGFNAGEFYQSYMPLKALGYQIDVAGLSKDTVMVRTDGEPDKRGRDWPADLAIADVDPSKYAALVIPGGYSRVSWRRNPRPLRCVRPSPRLTSRPQPSVMAHAC